jgi:acyl-CoA synthetase (AMP-forming)/AMP-acid ligase II
MYFYQALQRNARIFSNNTGTAFGERERTWKEVEQRVAKLASALIKHGVDQESHVAILSLNSDKYFEYYNAIPWIGGVVVPLNTRWSLKENVYSLDNSESSVLFVDDAFLEMGKALAEQCEQIRLIIYMGEGETPKNMLNYEKLIAQSVAIPPVNNDYNNLAGIFYTGGTTGFPKGVMLSHTNLWSSSIAVTAELGLNVEGERYLHVAPMFHIADVGVSYAMLIGGLCQVFLPSFDVDAVINVIEHKEINHVLLVPTMVTMMLASPTLDSANFTSLKHIVYGASPMPEGTLIAAMEKMPTVKFIQLYGQSELAPVISVLPAEYHVLEGSKASKIRSAGRAGYCIRVEIRDEDGNVLPVGKVGEITASGPNTMLGYWKNTEQTEKTLIDGWVSTGDAGYMDEGGFIFLVDRLKDMIVTGGENVFSVEVENALSHHSAILESVVLGIPSDKWGESVHAIIRLNEGQKITDKEIISHCREYIAGYKVPHSIEIRVEPFPITGAGKIMKNELRAPYWINETRAIN